MDPDKDALSHRPVPIGCALLILLLALGTIVWQLGLTLVTSVFGAFAFVLLGYLLLPTRVEVDFRAGTLTIRPPLSKRTVLELGTVRDVVVHRPSAPSGPTRGSQTWVELLVDGHAEPTRIGGSSNLPGTFEATAGTIKAWLRRRDGG